MGNTANPTQAIIQLMQQITGANKPGAAMSEKPPVSIPGTTNPASPDMNVTLGNGPLTQNQIAIPGTGVPPVQKQYANVKTSDQEFSTVSGNKRIAFNNMFTNAASMIQTHSKNQEAKETRLLAVDLERLLTASQNPNDPNNQQIIMDILSDKKKAKRIQEALDIKFMGADERDPVVKNALDVAMKKVGSAIGIGTGNPPPASKPPAQPNQLQQLQAAMGKPEFASILGRILGAPQVAGLTPEMQARMALVKAKVLPSADELIKANVDWNKALLNNATREQVAQVLATTKDKEMAIKLFQEIPKDYRAEVAARARMYDADQRLKGVKARVDAVLGKAGGDKAMTAEERNLLATINSQQKELQNALKTLGDTSFFNSKETNNKILDLKEKLNELHKNADQLRERVNKRLGLVMDGADNGNDNSGTGTTPKSSGTDDNFDATKLYNEITGGEQDD